LSNPAIRPPQPGEILKALQRDRPELGSVELGIWGALVNNAKERPPRVYVAILPGPILDVLEALEMAGLITHEAKTAPDKTLLFTIYTSSTWATMYSQAWADLDR
jgi:hypothetical protein